MSPTARPPRAGQHSSRPRLHVRNIHWTFHLGFLIAMVVFYFVVPMHPERSLLSLVIGLSIIAVCITGVGFIIIREAFYRRRVGEVRLRVPELLILVEITTIAFALAYYAMAIYSDDEVSGIHTRIDALYFCMTTLATTGYGDIHASGQLARLVVSLQLAFNVAFIAIVTQMLSSSFFRAESGRTPPQAVADRANANADADAGAGPGGDADRTEPRD
ncbi:hypothetical protein GSY69_01570 [Brevibacterium sp. 5221]|uniref:Potassium channel domain-containing protein n=1 Tax=Brevibacterium rongguiense TaxID=2695267 RepID=A0A6N9H460_9MICO|nr:potassium channel family protein [Brevibacterium rongguiense]MYM18699.1 hypothetical protein [Brevibacterium rongguiense]